MRVIAKMSEFDDLKPCCSRKPVVGSLVDLQECGDLIFDRYTIYCPVCQRMVADLAFRNAKFRWNQDIFREDCKEYLDHTFGSEVSE